MTLALERKKGKWGRIFENSNPPENLFALPEGYLDRVLCFHIGSILCRFACLSRGKFRRFSGRKKNGLEFKAIFLAGIA
jgi:hypothetical protein